MKIKKWWEQAVPVRVREFTYAVLGYLTVQLITYCVPYVGSFLVTVALLWGIICVYSWFGDAWRLLLEPKLLDKKYNIPLKPQYANA